MTVGGFWNVAGWPRPDEWSAFWGFGTCVIAAVAAALALLQLRAYFADRQAQARPYVIVDLAFKEDRMQVEVRNVSEAPATNVRLLVEPPFQSTSDYDAGVLAKVTGPDYVIRQLVPHRGIRWTLDSALLYSRRPDLPQTYRVTATYDDPRSRRRRKHAWQMWTPRLPASYVDTFDLSLDQWTESNLPIEW